MKKKSLAGCLALFAMLLSCSTDSSAPPGDIIVEELVKPSRTNIPDSNFEQALVDLDLDDQVDGSVITASIETIEDLVIEDKGITNLSGIEDFISLVGLWVSDNDLTTLNVSGNQNLKFVFANNNSLSSLLVNDLPNLEKIAVENNALTTLDISDNTALEQLSLAGNSLGAIDVSRITNVVQLNTFDVQNNPLTCIRVNAAQLDDIPAQWIKDEEDTYALQCN